MALPQNFVCVRPRGVLPEKLGEDAAGHSPKPLPSLFITRPKIILQSIPDSGLKYKNRTLIKTKMAKTLFMTKKVEKPCPLGPHPGHASYCFLGVLSVNVVPVFPSIDLIG